MRVSLARRRYQAAHTVGAVSTTFYLLQKTEETRKLLFFDARDPRQLERARQLAMQYGSGIKPVLVGGSYLDLMKHWKIKVYFDQRGALVERFKIRQVPALVYQENKRLRIDELETKP